MYGKPAGSDALERVRLPAAPSSRCAFMPISFLLYGRGYCHLCDDMRTALDRFASRYGFVVETIDVDADPLALAQYDELVPVLVGRRADGSLQTLCHYYLDTAAVLAFFETSGADPGKQLLTMNQSCDDE